MKTALKFLALNVMATICIGASVTSIFAQDECDTTYEQFKRLYRNPIVEDKKQAIKLAQKYLANDKCKTDVNIDIIKFLEGQLVKLPKAIDSLEESDTDPFNSPVKAENWDEAFVIGKQIIAKYPDTSLDVALVLASIGLDNAAATPPVDKYNTDAINLAKWALEHIDDKSYNADKYGAFGKYEYKTTAYPDGKNNAIGWMNYTIGYITYERLKNQKDALPYLYKATQANSATAKFPGIYREIGEWYLSEFNRIGEKRTESPVGHSNTTLDEKLALMALQKGYADRMLDAYIRAYNMAPSETQAEKDYKQSFYNRAKIFYSARFDQKMDNFEKIIDHMPNKPFPDPTSPVEPIVENIPTTTTDTKTTITTPAKSKTPARKSNQLNKLFGGWD